MRKVLIGLSGLMTSGPLLAHAGEHSDMAFLSVMLHLMTEHPLPMMMIAGVLGFVTLTRLRKN
ncbi:MAG: hypothetical protein P8163_18145 [Candidatus Thiodiazotropha sp.]|jgi:hypothetical protein